MLRYENMTVFARFKYSVDKAALRVHVWDIFDYANLNTSSLNDLFDSIHDQLCEVYDEQGFEDDVEEVHDEGITIASNEYESPSEDSANDMLVNDIGEITKFNVFADDVNEKLG